MGVLSCSRNGCNNIMCDVYVPSVGYICYECKNEFKNYLMAEGKSLANENDMNDELKLFMGTYQGRYIDSDGGFDIDKFFEEHSR